MVLGVVIESGQSFTYDKWSGYFLDDLIGILYPRSLLPGRVRQNNDHESDGVDAIPASVVFDQVNQVNGSSGGAAMKGKTFWVLLLAFLAGGGVLAWQAWQAWLGELPPGFASGNGRVESVQVDVTTKEPGRVETILVHEGDMVSPSQIVAKMDTVTLEAELARAEATVAEQEAKSFEVDAAIAKADSQLKLDELELAHQRPPQAQRGPP